MRIVLDENYNITVYGDYYDSVRILKGFSAHEFAVSIHGRKTTGNYPIFFVPSIFTISERINWTIS